MLLALFGELQQNIREGLERRSASCYSVSEEGTR
jgi:hypothetical protein